MRYLGFALLMALSAAALLGQGGIILHDKTGVCQLTLPGDWSASKSASWIGEAPGNAGNVQVVSQPGKTVRPLSAADQKALLVGKVVSNTPQSVFYANELPKNGNPLISYRAVAPGKGGTCVALFGVRSSVTVETLKTMVATLIAAQ
jgi:hypothetical protein